MAKIDSVRVVLAVSLQREKKHHVEHSDYIRSNIRTFFVM